MISMLPLILMANPMVNTDSFASVYNFKADATIILDETCFTYDNYSVNFTFQFYGDFYFNSVDSWEFYCRNLDSYLYCTTADDGYKTQSYLSCLEDLSDFDRPLFTFNDTNFNDEESFNIIAITVCRDYNGLNGFNVGITMHTLQNIFTFDGVCYYDGMSFPLNYRSRSDYSFDSTGAYYDSTYAFQNVVSSARAKVDTTDNFMYKYGYDEGKRNGDYNGYLRGTQDGYNTGKRDGYIEGYNEAYNEDSTAASIFGGILTIGLIPVDFFLEVFNFEILGINLTAFVTSMLTLMLVIIMMRTIFNGGSKS